MPTTVKASVADRWVDEVLAVGELAGRFTAARLPALRRAAVRWVRRPPAEPQPFALPVLRAHIQSLGYTPGRDLLVHSAMIKSLRAELDEVIAMLCDLVGPRGTLLMPSHPLITKEHEGLRVYEVAKSRSRVGLLTERFRRTEGVRRSPFPVAPVVALGPAAAEYTADFRERSGGTPYGEGSSYHLLAERGGMALFLGIDFIRALTLEHVAFDLLQGQHPIDHYYDEQTYWVVQADEAGPWTVREPRKALEGRLATSTMRRMVLRSGTLRAQPLHGVPMALLDARAFVDWHLPRVRTRGWPYWTPPRLG